MQVLELQQLRIHLLNVVLLSVERLEEFVEVILGADVFVEAQFLDYLAQFECLIRPSRQTKQVKARPAGVTYHLARASSLGFNLSSSKSALDRSMSILFLRSSKPTCFFK